MMEYLEGVLKKVDGLCSIIISHSSGQQVLKCDQADLLEQITKTDSAFQNAFGISMNNLKIQINKLGLGKNKKIISFYEKSQVIQIHMDDSNLFVTFIALESANTGIIISLLNDLKPLLCEINKNLEQFGDFDEE